MSPLRRAFLVWPVCFLLAAFTLPVLAQMRITEFMYGGANGEFVEFTNVGASAINLAGWSYSDSARLPGAVDLGQFGTVAAGESVILTEAAASDFRTAWSLCDSQKVIGGNTTNLGRSDEINLYDASQAQVDRLTYGDQVFPGTLRANAISGWVSAAGLGANDIAAWTLSAIGDGEGSLASAGGDIGSPGRSTRSAVAYSACTPPVGVMRITEYMYDGADAEFVEFTNVGNAPIDLGGWSFDDADRVPGSQDLSDFGTVAAGESVVLAEAAAADFRTAWNLCAGIKVIGGSTNNLGRSDEINLYDASQAQVDRLTYGDNTVGGPRTQTRSAWVSAAGLGNNLIADWTLSSLGDGEASLASTGGDVGSPGRSTRATMAFDPCAGSPDAPQVVIDPVTTSPRLDLAPAIAGAASGVIGDPTDPAATAGIGFTFAAGGGDASSLTIAVSSSNPDVVDAQGLQLSGSGATRQLTVTPHGVGYATITVSAVDASGNAGTYLIRYAASTAAATPETTRFHTGASDASATVALDADTMIVGDDETNVLRVYDRHHSGLPLAGFDFSGALALTDPDNLELDLEASARLDARIYWTTSFSNSKNFHVRPNRHRVFATDVTGTGSATSIAYVGRYDWLLEDLVAWDQANGHGLGASYLGFAAGSAEGVDSKTPGGFNIEGLALAPDDATAYFAFRAPLLPTNDRHQAVIVPVASFAALVTDAPDSPPPGSATFGAPIFLELGGRGIRSLDRNAAGQYLIVAGPPGDATGVAPADFRLYAWTGQPGDAPFELAVDLTAIDVNGGSFESIAEVPETLGAGSVLQFLFDNGDDVWYGDGIAGKDLAESRYKKAASLEAAVDVAFPAASIAAASGSGQISAIGTPFAMPLVVTVADAYGHPVANVSVAFAAPAGGASALLSAPSATTDAAGTAVVSATANTVAGSYLVVASINGVAATTAFALTNQVGLPAALTATGGTPQAVTVGVAFTDALVVHVVDAGGNAVADATVTFAAPTSGASADLSVSTAVTDANGDAQIGASANAIAGSYVVTASGDGIAVPATFDLTNTIDPASENVFRDGFETNAP